MAMHDNVDREAAEKRLWAEIDKKHTGMLGIVDGEPQHFQPMTAFADKDAGRIWFFTRSDTDLARDLADGRQAMFIVQAKDRELQACIGGALSQAMDRAKLEEFWSPHVAAWFPEGKDDPKLTMLCLDGEDARVWVTAAGPLRCASEVAKANAQHELPNIGGRADVQL
jgi:general stress protein 26